MATRNIKKLPDDPYEKLKAAGAANVHSELVLPHVLEFLGRINRRPA